MPLIILQNKEYALVLIDETTDGSASEGCLLTDRHIYSHRFGKKRLSLLKLTKVETLAEAGTGSAIRLNNRLTLSFPWLPKPSVRLIADMLENMSRYSRKGS